MTEKEKNIINNFKTVTKENLKIIRNFLDVVVPVNDVDKQIMAVGSDMIDSIIDDLDNACINELSAMFNISNIIEYWEDILPILQDIDSYKVTSTFIEEVIGKYEGQ